MSLFYGTVDGMSKTVATRRGSRNSGIKATVQSWDGSLISRMWYDDEDRLIVELQADSCGSSPYGDRLFRGTLDDLVKKLKESEGRIEK